MDYNSNILLGEEYYTNDPDMPYGRAEGITFSRGSDGSIVECTAILGVTLDVPQLRFKLYNSANLTLKQ